MRILIDTNIFLPLEDASSALDSSIAELARLASTHQHALIIHPASIDDINRDSNQSRKTINLSRVAKYQRLENPPVLSSAEAIRLGLVAANDNDRVDNELLFALYRNAAGLLVTEDRKIHRSAKALGLADRVHHVRQSVEFLNRVYSRTRITLPSIKEIPLHQIDVNLPFFDSLRGDYTPFNAWFAKAAQEGRTAWVHTVDAGSLAAICIYNEEASPIVTSDDRALAGKVLKLCTLKVGEEVRGRKIGELFLKAAFRYATSNAIGKIYVTIRPGKHDLLEDLCRNFGFQHFGHDKNGDGVYVKEHPVAPPTPDLPPLDYNIRFYPYFRGDSEIRKFIVPIMPTFHEMLFPEAQDQQTLFHAAVGNAIKQAYLCHARDGSIMPGDIVFFYRSHDTQAITSMGIVELVRDLDNADQIMELVSKRTVFRREDIEVMAAKQTKVILFRLAHHLDRPIPFNWLDLHVVKGPIQTIRRIDHDAYLRLIQERPALSRFSSH